MLVKANAYQMYNLNNLELIGHHAGADLLMALLGCSKMPRGYAGLLHKTIDNTLNIKYFVRVTTLGSKLCTIFVGTF